VLLWFSADMSFNNKKAILLCRVAACLLCSKGMWRVEGLQRLSLGHPEQVHKVLAPVVSTFHEHVCCYSSCHSWVLLLFLLLRLILGKLWEMKKIGGGRGGNKEFNLRVSLSVSLLTKRWKVKVTHVQAVRLCTGRTARK